MTSFNQEEFENYLPHIRVCTDINDHMGARLMLARAIKHERAEKVFLALSSLRTVEMEVTEPMQEIARNWTKQMLRWIDMYHPSQSERVRQCL